MLKERYHYIAVFNYADDGISVSFPDLPGCLSCADTTDEALKNAKEVLGLFLWGMEKDGDEIPNPTVLEEVILQTGDIPVLIDVFMPPIREKMDNRYVKKTLSIPSWLNQMASEANINFSGVLQDALKSKLHVK